MYMYIYIYIYTCIHTYSIKLPTSGNFNREDLHGSRVSRRSLLERTKGTLGKGTVQNIDVRYMCDTLQCVVETMSLERERERERGRYIHMHIYTYMYIYIYIYIERERENYLSIST